MRTPICDVLGIEFPIFAFSHCRDVVAAVSRAGGFGVLGALAFSPEQLELELKWVDENIDGKPYGVDVVMPASYVGKEQGDLQKIDLEKMIPRHGRQDKRFFTDGQKNVLPHFQDDELVFFCLRTNLVHDVFWQRATHKRCTFSKFANRQRTKLIR